MQIPPAMPTDTPIPYPTPSPLPPREVSSLIIKDDFSSVAVWNTMGNSVVVDGNRLTINIEKSHSYIFSLRNAPTIDNFCAEIDAHPVICEGKDSYGFVFRSNGSSSYRYALSCDGKVRFELREIFKDPQIIQNAYSSADVPIGSPDDVRLGVCATGTKMFFYLNGNHQFTIEDDKLSEAGSIGVFAETAPENNKVTVDFSRLLLYFVDTH